MTTIYAAKSKGYFIIAAREHAGDKLICAAISAAMCGLYNTVHIQRNIKPGECDGFESMGGAATVRWCGGSEADAIYEYAMDIFRALEASYPDNIKILPHNGGEIS